MKKQIFEPQDIDWIRIENTKYATYNSLIEYLTNLEGRVKLLENAVCVLDFEKQDNGSNYYD